MSPSPSIRFELQMRPPRWAVFFVYVRVLNFVSLTAIVAQSTASFGPEYYVFVREVYPSTNLGNIMDSRWEDMTPRQRMDHIVDTFRVCIVCGVYEPFQFLTDECCMNERGQRCRFPDPPAAPVDSSTIFRRPPDTTLPRETAQTTSPSSSYTTNNTRQHQKRQRPSSASHTTEADGTKSSRIASGQQPSAIESDDTKGNTTMLVMKKPAASASSSQKES